MAAPAPAPAKRCHYEVLGLPRDCTADDVRSAFKRLALRLHPDKLSPAASAAEKEAAAAAFVELRAAHDVLSDPRERAYYDSHRSQILFADFSTSGDFSPDELFAYFSASAFSGFEDTGRGFFKVYGDAFGKIYGNEVKFASRMGGDSVPVPPAIGNLKSDYVQVSAFYAYWTGFSTVMDFNWVDEYDAAMGANRRSRRLMEEENKKVRKKAKREYNDTVRALTLFVKKRDKRVVDMALKKKAEDEKRKREELERKKDEERKKAEMASKYVEQEWAKVDEVGDAMGSSGEDEEAKERKNELYCAACSKKFKSEKQWKNHEQSRKHREKVAELRAVLEEEEKSLGTAEDDDEKADETWEDVNVDFDYDVPAESGSDSVEELTEELKGGLHLDDEEGGDPVGVNRVNSFNVLVDDDEPQHVNEEESKCLSSHNNLNGHKSQGEPSVSGVDDSEGEEERSFLAPNTRVKCNTRRAMKNKEKQRDDADAATGSEENENGSSQIKGEPQKQEGNMEGNVAETLSSAEELSTSQQAGKNKDLKKKSKKKSGKKEATADQKDTSRGSKKLEMASDPVTYCETCGESFNSRNKLFEHLESTGHAKLKTRSKGRRR